MPSTRLPPLPAEQTAHSAQCQAWIQQQIIAAGGSVSFAQFMQWALYAPELGYYRSGKQLFGASGDFITAPGISPLFAESIAHSLAPLLKQPQQKLLELGPGDGTLASQLLLALEALDALPQYYYCLEISAALKARQQHNIQQQCPHLYKRVQWITSLPKSGFQGAILANEVLDAMPCEGFLYQDQQFYQLMVELKKSIPKNKQAITKNQPLNYNLELSQHELALSRRPAPATLQKALQAIKKLWQQVPVASPYLSEINLQHNAWIHSLAESLESGIILLFDYGYPRHEYYHPQRSQGTLSCFYHHHQHNNPLLYPGCQDITAHVDFTAIAEAAYEAGLELRGYTSQAQFLYATGLAQRLTPHPDPVQQYRLSQQLQLLTSPAEMGERVKVMALSKQLQMPWEEHPASGFSLDNDRSHQLGGMA